MKKTSRLLIGAALVAAVALSGCGLDEGIGKTSGTKTNLNITVDATDDATKPLEEGTKYRRFIKQIGSSEKIAEITTTITINKKDSILEGKSIDDPTKKTYAVVGYAFDLNKNNNDNKKYDMVLFGFRPVGSDYYLEHYSGFDKKDELDTSESSVCKADKFISNTDNATGFVKVPTGSYKTDEDGNYILEVSVKQTTKGTYEFFLGEKSLGTYTGATIGTTDIEETGYDKKVAGYAIGGVAGYVNCPKGTKIVANYATDKESVTGRFYEEVEE